MVFDRILVGYDASPQARRVWNVALEIGARFHSQMTIAFVSPTDRKGADPYLESLVPLPHEGKAFSTLVEELRPKAVERGAGGLQSVVLVGDVLDSLLQWINAHPQDLVVVGSRGLSRGRRILQGSVSSGLVAEAPCPVLVVRPGREARHRPPDEGGA